MTSDLRKTHKIIWVLLLLIVPVLIALSVLGIKEPIITDANLVVSAYKTEQPIIWEDEHFTISTKEQATSNLLVVVSKKSLESPSAPVFSSTSKNDEGVLIETMDKKGIYTFEFEETTKVVRMYNGIREQDILKIKL